MRQQHPAAVLAAMIGLFTAACAGPAIRLEPPAANAEQPLAFEVRDWDWNGSSFELELRVTNHGERTVVLERGFLALSDGGPAMSPTSRPATCRIAPRRSRTVYLCYPAVDERAAALTLSFGPGAVCYDGRDGEPVPVPPLRLRVGDAAAAPAEPGR